MFGLSYISLALTNGSKLQYLASWAALAITGVGATAITFTRAVNGAFQRRRGLALGITLAGSGVSVIVLKLCGQPLIDALGWRTAAVLCGLSPIVIAMPLVLWGLPGSRTAAVAASRPPPAGEATGLSLGQALQGWRFWVLVMAFVPSAFAGTAIMPNVEHILRQAHLAVGAIPAVTSLIGVSIILGRVGGGYIIDRVWAPLVAFAVAVSGAAGCLVLAQPTLAVWQAGPAVMLVGLGAGAEIDLIAFLVVRYMGLRDYGQIYGVMLGLFFVAAGLGPSAFAKAFEYSGGYGRILWVSGVVMVVSGAFNLVLGRYPAFGRAEDSNPAGLAAVSADLA
jgi:predicted MFS family arabinose efflux permease